MHVLEIKSWKSLLQIVLTVLFLFSLVTAAASSEAVLGKGNGARKGYTKGELVPVSCLNRTMLVALPVTDLQILD